MKRLEDIIFSGYKWSARRLIIRINEIVRGWGNYHAYLCPPDYLQKLDDELNDFLWQWAVSRWQNKTVSWIYNHYWKFQHEKEMRRFASGDKELVLFSDIKTKMPIKAEYHKNPYLEHKYFRERRKTEYEYKPILSEHF